MRRPHPGSGERAHLGVARSIGQSQRESVAPWLRRGIVARQRVGTALDGGWEASATLVAAPAGFGKSVAVETWSEGRGYTAAWVPLHASDNDFVRLWSSVASSVERSRPGVGADALRLLQGPAAHARPAINALALALAADGRPLVIVLDDVQLVTDEHCLGSLDLAIDTLPENVCLVLISRTIPRLRIARLRAQGRLVEVRSPALAFTPEEVRALFAAVDGVALDADTVAALTARTEGWPAAVYLAALWLRGHDAPETALRALKGSRKHMHEFLTSEVLTDLDAGTRRFLLRSSVGLELSGALCDAVLEVTGSHQRLSELERTNLLVVPIGDELGWYRYHSVLRDHLLAELAASDPADERALRRRALTWSLEQGRVEAAAEYAQAAGDWEALARLVEAHQLRLLRTGRAATLARWTAALPREALLAHPSALVATVIAAHAVGRPAPQIRRLLALTRTARPALKPADAAGLQLALASYTDDDVGEAQLAAEAAVALAAAHTELEVAALGVLALTSLLAGDDDRAEASARSALAHPDAGERPFGYVVAASTLATVDAWKGRRWSARTHADRALAMARNSGFTRSSDSFAQLADAIAAAAEGRLAHAQRAAERAARTTIEGGVWQAWTSLELAAIQLRRGLTDAARRSLDHASELLDVARDAGRLPARADELRHALDAAHAQVTAAPAELPSAAEHAVLRLLPGSTVREIGEALFLSPNTVKSHLRSLYRKLGVSSREDAVARAVALGLIDEPAS